jgi:hypothetical protein
MEIAGSVPVAIAHQLVRRRRTGYLRSSRREQEESRTVTSVVRKPETLFQEFGFVRDRRIAKWRWVMRLRIPER